MGRTRNVTVLKHSRLRSKIYWYLSTQKKLTSTTRSNARCTVGVKVASKLRFRMRSTVEQCVTRCPWVTNLGALT